MADVTQSPKYNYFRQFLSQYMSGTNIDALINTIADEGQRRQDLSIAVNDQLSISTASGVYLQALLAEKGITVPGDIGMSDFAFANMGIQINAIKQVSYIVNKVLETFYGPAATRANTISTQSEPYFLNPGDQLMFVVDNGTQYTITVKAEQFNNIQQATAQEVCNVITQFLAALGQMGYAQVYQDPDTELNYVQMFGGAVGPYSFIQVVGGEIQNELEFPIIRDTNLPVNNTVWQITRPHGSTYRFTWVAGSQPQLENVFIGDYAMIFGPEFEALGIYGTFPVTNIRPATTGPSYEGGWFEVTIPNLTILYSSTPNIAPPVNNPPVFYSLTAAQNSFYDLNFFLPKRCSAGSQIRYALAWEPKPALLKVYMPATTQVVQRTLIGATHMHMLYPADSLNLNYGSATPGPKQLLITSEYSFTVQDIGFDNIATGGTIVYGATTIPVEYVRRENNTLRFFTTIPHGLTGNAPDQYGRVYSSQTVLLTVGNQPADDPVNTFLGNYMVDPTVNYTLTSTQATSNELIVQGRNPGTLFVEGVLPAGPGLLLFDLGYDNQEGPVKYISSQSAGLANAVSILTISQNGTNVTVNLDGASGAVPGSIVNISGTTHFNGNHTVVSVPSPTSYTYTAGASGVYFETDGLSTLVPTGNTSTVVLDPAYEFQFQHNIGANITLCSAATAYTPKPDGSDYGDYITGIAEATAYAQSIIDLIVACGINLEIIIVYPSDIGLGNAGDGELPTSVPQSDAVEVWGV